jgi:hypothetical protein
VPHNPMDIISVYCSTLVSETKVYSRMDYMIMMILMSNKLTQLTYALIPHNKVDINISSVIIRP